MSLSSLRLLPSLLLAVLVLQAACGSSGDSVGSGSSSSNPARTSQGPLAQDAWQALLKDDAALAALDAGQPQPFQVAGQIVAADGTTLVWAEHAADANAARDQVTAVFRSCPQVEAGATPTCIRGKAAYTATSATFTDDAGKTLTSIPFGAPQPWEWETSTNLDKDNSTIVAGLAGDAPPLDVATVLAQFNAVLAQKRRFILLNSYGSALGVDGSEIAKVAQDSGRFDSVETIEYVRQRDIEQLLPSLTVLDTVVWLGSGVQQKPSKSSPPTKAVGMNISRGVFGDEVYYGKRAAPVLEVPPLGGPGLIVLAGQNTFLGDINDKQSLAAVWYEPGTRPIVGFSLPLGTPGPTGYTHLSWNDVIGTTASFIKRLGNGDTLDAAMVGAADGQAFTLTSPMATDNRKKWTWTVANSGFWSKQPTTGSLTLQMNLTPNCVQPVDTCDLAGWKAGNKASGTVNGPIKIVCKDPVFVGPYFSCTGGDTQPPGTKFDVSGVLRGHGAGDHVLFLAHADDSGPLGGAVLLGDGVFTKDGLDVGGGTTTYPFDGQAVLSTYTDAQGRCCVTAPPQLTGTSASDLSAFQLHN